MRLLAYRKLFLQGDLKMKYFSRKQNQQTQQNTQQGRIILTKSIAIATEFFLRLSTEGLSLG